MSYQVEVTFVDGTKEIFESASTHVGVPIGSGWAGIGEQGRMLAIGDADKCIRVYNWDLVQKVTYTPVSE